MFLPWVAFDQQEIFCRLPYFFTIRSNSLQTPTTCLPLACVRLPPRPDKTLLLLLSFESPSLSTGGGVVAGDVAVAAASQHFLLLLQVPAKQEKRRGRHLPPIFTGIPF